MLWRMDAELTREGHVRSVAVITTGSVDIHPQHAFGSRLPLYAWIMASRRWLPARPINVFVIDHADGLILFDAGVDRGVLTDADYYPAGLVGWLYRRLARFHVGPRDSLGPALTALGFETSSVRIVVLSHLHQDDVGGIRAVRHADMVVTEREWGDMTRPGAELIGIIRRHIDLPGLRWRRIRFDADSSPELAPFTSSYDLMGDGSLVLLPTPGHTPGSMSLLVRRCEGPPLLMVSDLTFGVDLMEHGRIPGVGSRQSLLDSTARV